MSVMLWVCSTVGTPILATQSVITNSTVTAFRLVAEPIDSRMVCNLSRKVMLLS